MKNNIQTVIKKFNGKIIGRPFVSLYIAETLLFFPHEVIGYITKYVWFISSMHDSWALTFNGDDVKDKHLIFLSDELLSQEKPQIMHTIAHEIAHVVLGHRNAIGSTQTKVEIQRQEQQADTFANFYLYGGGEKYEQME